MSNSSTKYKDSPLGKIPGDWDVKNLGEIAEVKGGKRIPKGESLSAENTGFPYIRVSDMFMGGVDSSKILFVPKHVEPLIRNYKIKKEELFITVAGTIGLVGEIPEELDNANLTENANKIIVKMADKKYVLFFLMSDKIQGIIKGTTTNNAQPKLALERIREFKIALPPLPEQKAIAHILGLMDAAINKNNSLISKKELQKKWLMQNLLTGKKRLKGFNGEWNKLGAGEIFKSISVKGFDNEELLSATQDRGIIPRSMLEGRVTMPTSGTESYKLVEPGDFVVSLRSFQGGLEYSYYKGIVSPAYTILKRKKKIDDEFYKQYFKSYDFIGHLAIAVIGIRDGKQISYDDFCAVRIPYPSPEEQSTIANLLQAADKEIQLLKTKTEKLGEVKKGLMQVLLTGRKTLLI